MNGLNLFTRKDAAVTDEGMYMPPLKSRALRDTIPTILLAAILLAPYPGAMAATKNFISANGDWNTSSNWSPAGVPVGADTAIIDGGRTAQLAGSGTATTVQIGYVNTSGTNFLIVSSTASLVQLGGESRIGYSASTKGSVTVDGTWAGIGTFYVGSSGEGTLAIGSTGTVSSGALTVSTAAGSKGILTINGGMSNTTATIGNNAGSNGSVAVGGIWVSSGALTIGSLGMGTVTIDGAGKASSGALTVGNADGSKGSLTISGSMSNTTATIGSQAGSDGTVGVSGTWTNSGAVTIGGSGTGGLTVNAGGRVTSASTITIGSGAGSNGSALIQNTGTVSSGGLTVGSANGSTGVLTINGSMLNTTGAIANSAGSKGSVFVSGTWANSSALTIGGAGTGDLTVNSGGIVTSVGNTTIGSLTNGVGNVTVRGALNNVSGDIWIGSQGTGVLTVGEGGSVSVNNGSGVVYLNVGNSGTLNIGAAVTGTTPEVAEGAGIVKATEIAKGGANGAASTLNFNHTGTAYYFTTTGSASGTAIKISGANTTVNAYAGKTVLARDNYYGGGTTVTGSTAHLVAALSGALGSGAATVSNGGILEVASGVTMSNVVSLNGGTLLLSDGVANGVVQFSGTGGGISGNGTIGSAVTLTSGNTLEAGGEGIGVLTFGSPLILESSSVTRFDINSFTSGNYDLLSGASESITLGGTLDINFQSGFNELGSISIVDFQFFSGTFETVNFTGLEAGYSASFDEASGVLTVVPEPSTWVLLSLAFLGLIGVRRSSRFYAKL